MVCKYFGEVVLDGVEGQKLCFELCSKVKDLIALTM